MIGFLRWTPFSKFRNSYVYVGEASRYVQVCADSTQSSEYHKMDQFLRVLKQSPQLGLPHLWQGWSCRQGDDKCSTGQIGHSYVSFSRSLRCQSCFIWTVNLKSELLEGISAFGWAYETLIGLRWSLNRSYTSIPKPSPIHKHFAIPTIRNLYLGR